MSPTAEVLRDEDALRALVPPPTERITAKRVVMREPVLDDCVTYSWPATTTLTPSSGTGIIESEAYRPLINSELDSGWRPVPAEDSPSAEAEPADEAPELRRPVLQGAD